MQAASCSSGMSQELVKLFERYGTMCSSTVRGTQLECSIYQQTDSSVSSVICSQIQQPCIINQCQSTSPWHVTCVCGTQHPTANHLSLNPSNVHITRGLRQLIYNMT